MSVRLYVEGGGDSKALKTACRRGFRRLLENAGLKGRMPRIVACGGRDDAIDDFKRAHAQGTVERPVLLVDAEGPVHTDDPWEHLENRDGWNCPDGANDGQCHLMVQVMESWFLADRDGLAAYFGDGFREHKLPGTPDDVESIPKQDVLNGLRQASRDTQKGKYGKGPHSFAVLERLDPERVENGSEWAARLLNTLRDVL